MDDFELLFSGQITASDFMAILFADDALTARLNALIPQEAKIDPNHELWSCISRGKLEPYQFRVRDMLYSWYGFAEKQSDQRDVYNLIRKLYCWNYPNTNCKELRDEEFDLRLELTGEVYGGKEIEHIIDRILAETKEIRKKTERKKEAKRLLRLYFHTDNRNIPRWIQGACWPMGEKSPMQFVGKKHHGEQVNYTFRDVDTGEERVVIQFY